MIQDINLLWLNIIRAINEYVNARKFSFVKLIISSHDYVVLMWDVGPYVLNVINTNSSSNPDILKLG